MATGVYMGESAAFKRLGENPDVSIRVYFSGDRTFADAEDHMVVGARVTNTPINILGQTLVGCYSASFVSDFYSRIYFIPKKLEFGAISGATSQVVTVWNAYFTGKTLGSITLVNATGVTLVGQALPFVIGALATTDYQVQVSSSGPPDLDATLTFDFGTESHDYSVTGTRAVVVPFAPNWDRPYDMDFIFKTEMFKSRSGREQRRALREFPRRKASFSLTRKDEELKKYLELMYSWINNVIIVPDFSRRTASTATMNAGIDTMSVDSVDPWALPEATVVLSNGGYTETRVILSVGASTLVFKTTGTVAFPSGTTVMPALTGRMPKQTADTLETNRLTVVPFEIEVSPGTEIQPAIPVAPVTFDGLELFNVQPNWAGQIGIKYSSGREDVDYGRGRTEVFTPYDFTERVFRATYNGLDSARSVKLIDFFLRNKGQLGEFYTPSWQDDITPKDAPTAGNNFMRIEGQNFLEAFGGSTVHAAMVVNQFDGTKTYKKIDSIFAVSDLDGDDTLIQITDTWAASIPLENVSSVSWVFRSRFATDTLSVTWVTDTVSDIQMTFKSLEALA